MLTGFLRAFRTPDLRRKLLFTLFMIGVFRLGASLPTPGISEKSVNFCTGLAAQSGGYTRLAPTGVNYRASPGPGPASDGLPARRGCPWDRPQVRSQIDGF